MKCRIGSGYVSACGGNGFAGGGGGRVSVDVFSRHEDPEFFANGRTQNVIFFMELIILSHYSYLLSRKFYSSCKFDIILLFLHRIFGTFLVL